MDESSMKCCEAMERFAAAAAASTSNVRRRLTACNNYLYCKDNNKNAEDVGGDGDGKRDKNIGYGGRNVGRSTECKSPPYELDHMYANNNNNNTNNGDDDGANLARPNNKTNASPSSSSNSNEIASCNQQQLVCMRELVFLHLDLIQEQQDQLDSLKQENDGLKEQLDCTKVRLETLENENEKLRDNCDRKLICSVKNNGNRVRNRNSSSTESPNKRSRYDSIDYNRSNSKKSERKLSTSIQQPKKDVLQTDVTYFTCIGTPESASALNPVDQDTVMIPCWRLRPITSCYQMEGTEVTSERNNLEDDIFMKRHQKLEIDEKRRKRWDIQRIREQRLQEKLRKGRQTRDENLRNRSPDFDTFYPRPDDVQFIEVSDTLPVLAFGYPIPSVSNSEFQVPWLNSSDKSWSEIGRASRGSKRGT